MKLCARDNVRPTVNVESTLDLNYVILLPERATINRFSGPLKAPGWIVWITVSRSEISLHLVNFEKLLFLMILILF